jgi:hypothetical protein
MYANCSSDVWDYATVSAGEKEGQLKTNGRLELLQARADSVGDKRFVHWGVEGI